MCATPASDKDASVSTAPGKKDVRRNEEDQCHQACENEIAILNVTFLQEMAMALSSTCLHCTLHINHASPILNLIYCLHTRDSQTNSNNEKHPTF